MKSGSTWGLWYLGNSEIYVAKYKPWRGGARGGHQGRETQVLVFTLQHETVFPQVTSKLRMALTNG